MRWESALRPGADADHFVDINGMVGDLVAAVGAGFPGFGKNRDEVAEVGVFEYAGHFAGGPEFVAGWIQAFDALEGIAAGRGRYLLHLFNF